MHEWSNQNKILKAIEVLKEKALEVCNHKEDLAKVNEQKIF